MPFGVLETHARSWDTFSTFHVGSVHTPYSDLETYSKEEKGGAFQFSDFSFLDFFSYGMVGWRLDTARAVQQSPLFRVNNYLLEDNENTTL
jgi:hypothetical protein